MVREIKFRAWDNIQEQIINPNGLHSNSEPIYRFLNNKNGQNRLDFMQYTGLKDKNGVEIYEGDIVRASLLGDGKHHGHKNEVQFTGNGIIEIDPVHLMVNFKDANRDNFYIYEAILHRETEVIGNIYENSELLGSK